MILAIKVSTEIPKDYLTLKQRYLLQNYCIMQHTRKKPADRAMFWEKERLFSTNIANSDPNIKMQKRN